MIVPHLPRNMDMKNNLQIPRHHGVPSLYFTSSHGHATDPASTQQYHGVPSLLCTSSHALSIQRLQMSEKMNQLTLVFSRPTAWQQLRLPEQEQSPARAHRRPHNAACVVDDRPTLASSGTSTGTTRLKMFGGRLQTHRFAERTREHDFTASTLSFSVFTTCTPDRKTAKL